VENPGLPICIDCQQIPPRPGDRQCRGDGQLSTAQIDRDRTAGRQCRVEHNHVRPAARHRAVNGHVGIRCLNRLAQCHFAVGFKIVRCRRGDSDCAGQDGREAPDVPVRCQPQFPIVGLRTVTENAVKDFVKSLNDRKVGAGGSAILQKLAQVEATAELEKRLQDAFDLELADEAMRRIRSRVSEDRWLAWQMTSQERLTGAEVAARLNMKVVSVYTVRNQVQKLIREEVAKLEGRPAAQG